MTESETRIQRVQAFPRNATTLLETVAVLCGNHHRRGTDDPSSLLSLANAILVVEPKIRKLLTGDPQGEIKGCLTDTNYQLPE